VTVRETCLQRAEQSRLMASGMYCRSNAEAKAAALKAAAVYKMIAGWADSMEGAALADRCMAAADDYLRSAKPYAKRAVSTERAAYVKGAAVLREMAEVARRAEVETPQHWTEVLADAGVSAACSEEIPPPSAPPPYRRPYGRRTTPAQDSTEE
jgi:hypothetical protein